MAGPVTLQARAKLTLSLRITGTRPDGFHLLDAEMVSLDLADTLEIDDGGRELTIVGGGPDVMTGPDNLVTRALAAVGRTASVRLTKRIPSGAGLGGGSADAACILRWAGCNDLDVAAALGADVPFCLIGGRARVRGIGDIVEPLPPAAGVWTLLTPPFHVSTPLVYRAWDEMGGPRSEGPNDLEPAALAVEPELATWRARLAEASGRTPVLAGSGGTWFVQGAFPGDGRVVVRTR